MLFADATLLLDVEDVRDQLTRFSVAGGMPRYLTAFGSGGLERLLAEVLVDPRSQLFNEPRTLLQTELREPTVYFSILGELAVKPKDAAAVAAALRMETRELSGYLTTLESLQLVARRRPVGAAESSRTTQWRCTDHFVRFWFRFVRPYQAELEAGADPRSHVKINILPHLADHAATVFEDVVTSWVRARHAGATAVGAWWGPALHRLRAAKERTTEEIDTVALRGRKVAAVAEAKWTNKVLGAAVLSDLLEYKLPALAQAGFDVSEAEIVLASRSGFSAGLRTLAEATPQTKLVEASDLLAQVAARW
jgi:hypothetical protein